MINAPGAWRGRAGCSGLRIVIPALWYHPEHPSGSSRLAYDEAKYLSEAGHDVWLVAMDGGAGQPEHVLDGALHVLRYHRPRWSMVDPIGSHERAVRRVLARHVAGDVDVIHGHMLLPMSAAISSCGIAPRVCYSLHSPVRAELLAAQRRAPVAERIRLRLAAAVRSRHEARILARCDGSTCFSNFTRELVAAFHGAEIASRMRVVPGWVDLSRFRIVADRAAARRSLGWPTDRPVLFCLRRFVPRMGLEGLLAAAARVQTSGHAFRLVLAGDGPLRGRLVARARTLGLADSVEFPGRVADATLPSMYGAADAFVLPSAELECFGLIAVEALACGTPVVATPVGAIPEVLGDLAPQWLAKDAGPDAVATHIAQFLDGRLPGPPPAELRDFVARRYAASSRIPELVAFALGEDGAAPVGRV